MGWSERERLLFIERLLYWRGYINRRDLMEHFSISAPQATNDLVNYTTRAPGNCNYNVRTKRYEASSEIEPILIQPEFSIDLGKLGSVCWPSDEVDFVLRAERPRREVSMQTMRALVLAAQRRDSLEIRYWSMNSGTAIWRRISPRAFGHDGLRWHVRAYCHKNEDFRDFVIGRMKGLRRPTPCPVPDLPDEAWMRSITMVIRASSELTANKRKALEMDYGMKRGKLNLSVREAMLTYTARRMGFIKDLDKLPVRNELGELDLIAIE